MFSKLTGEEFELLLDRVIGRWIQFEKPILAGKQIMTRTFQLADLRGRKTIDVYPNAESGEWVLILDGGMKLRLNSEIPIEKIGVPKEKFSQNELKKLIQSSERKDIYQKGLQWENAVEYFLNCIAGLQISGRRVKAISQEIDLSVVNVSLDNKLWEMGAYILVECKNWNRKVGIQVIRGLAHISELKGNKVKNNKECYQLLVDKWNELQARVEGELML